MPTLGHTRALLIEALLIAGIEESEARVEADLIIEHTTGFPKAKQMAHPELELTQEAHLKIASIVSQRRKRMPLQYLLGEQWFMGLRFLVRPGVLIPRPDTELLVELAVKFLGEFEKPSFVDIGTGSGAIAVSILRALPNATGFALDVSSIALTVAEENAVLNKVANRLTFERGDWLSFKPPHPFDAVVCNPPYIPEKTASQLQKEVVDYEPKEALFGSGEDGLGFFRDLSLKAQALLGKQSTMFLEIGFGQQNDVEAILRNAGWHDVCPHNDISGTARCLSARHTSEAIEK